jgi:hypothetical protein
MAEKRGLSKCSTLAITNRDRKQELRVFVVNFVVNFVDEGDDKVDDRVGLQADVSL